MWKCTEHPLLKGRERLLFPVNQSRSAWKHDQDAGTNKNTEFPDVLLPGSSKKYVQGFSVTHSKILPPQFTETPPLDLCIIPVTRKQINKCTHDQRHHVPGWGSEKKKKKGWHMSAAGFKKRCKVIDCNNPAQYTVVQISGIRCLHNMLRVGLTFKLSLRTVDSAWDENEVFFHDVILTIPDYPITTLNCLTHIISFPGSMHFLCSFLRFCFSFFLSRWVTLQRAADCYWLESYYRWHLPSSHLDNYGHNSMEADINAANMMSLMDVRSLCVSLSESF